MRTKKRVMILGLSLACAFVTAGAVASGVTYAAFAGMGKVFQQVGYSGNAKKTIYLNANGAVWSAEGATFYLYAIPKSNVDATPAIVNFTRPINPRINSIDFTMYLFEFDWQIYDKFRFLRVKDDASVESLEAMTEEQLTADSKSDVIYGFTDQITETINKNYYCITSAAVADHERYTYSDNKLVINNGTLSFVS